MRKIITCHAYCLTRDGKSLTEMNRACTKKTLDLALKFPEAIIVFSTAYKKYWRKEARLKLLMASEMGISLDRIRIIKAIIDSYTEIKALKKKFNFECVELHPVLDYYHAPRAMKLYHKYFPGINIVPHKVKTKQYMRTLEPPYLKFFYLKSIRAGNKILWILWNLLANLVK